MVVRKRFRPENRKTPSAPTRSVTRKIQATTNPVVEKENKRHPTSIGEATRVTRGRQPHPCLDRQVASTSSLVQHRELIGHSRHQRKESQNARTHSRQILGWTRSLCQKDASAPGGEMKPQPCRESKNRRELDASPFVSKDKALSTIQHAAAEEK